MSWCRAIFLLGPLIYAYTVVLGSLSLLLSLGDRSGRAQHGCARLWARLILRTTLSPVTVSSEAAALDMSLPRVFAANHISALDIPVLYAHLPGQFRILAKRELFRYPFLGWHLRRSGQLPIDQDNSTSALRSLRKAVDTLNRGMPLVIFPEGGRSENGQVQPFMSGAFYLAIKAQVEVVPVAIVGTYEVLPMKHFHIHPGPIRLVWGQPISTAGMSLRDIEKLSQRVQQAIEGMYYKYSQVPDPAKAAAQTAI